MPLFEVRRGNGTGYGSSAAPAARMTTMGELVAVDFITAALLDGRGYQVRAGTIATGIAAQDVIADATAEMCQDAATGATVIPIKFRIGIRGIATATTVQIAVKAHGAVSTSGTAFVPLPLLQGGTASGQTARVQAGTVVVPAETVTATTRLFEYEDVNTQTPTSDLGKIHQATIAAAATDLRYIGVGPAVVYVQVAATTAFNLYFATLDSLQFPSLLVSPS